MNQFEKLTKYEIIENYPEYRLYIKKDDYNEIYSLNNALKKSASQKTTQRGSISIKFSENDILYKLPFKSYVLINSNSDYANIGTFKIGSKITLTYKKNTSNSIEKTTTLTCSSGENNYVINVDNSSSTIISGGGISGNNSGNSGGNSGGNTGGNSGGNSGGNTTERIFTVELSGINTSENSGNIMYKTSKLGTTQYKIFSANSSIAPLIDIHVENIDVNVISVHGFNSFTSGQKITTKTYFERLNLSSGNRYSLTLSDSDLYRTFKLEIMYVNPSYMNINYNPEVTFPEESYFNISFDSNYVGDNYYFDWTSRAGTLIKPLNLSDGVKQQITKTEYSFKYHYTGNEDETNNGGYFSLYQEDYIIYKKNVYITLHEYDEPEEYYVDFRLVDIPESDIVRTQRTINNHDYWTVEAWFDLTKESTHRVKINTNIPGGSISVLRFGSEAGRLYIKYPGSSSFETSNSFYDIPISYLDGEQIFEIKLTQQDTNCLYIPFYTLINYNENHVYDALIFGNSKYNS